MTEKEHQRRTGHRLEMAIEALNLTKAEVCRELGVTAPRLANWLAGTHYPNPYFLTRFCDRYGITMDWIYREQVAGVAGPLGGALWAAVEASQSAPAEAAAQARGRGRPRKMNMRKAETT